MTAHHAWHRVLYARAKTHAVPGCLLGPMLRELSARGMEPEAVSHYKPIQRIRDWGLDLGGMVHAHEPHRQYRADNLPIHVLSSQVGSVFATLRACGRRSFGTGRDYYKWHGAWHCIVLLPRQWSSLIEQMRADAHTAEVEADSFFAAALESQRARQARQAEVTS